MDRPKTRWPFSICAVSTSCKVEQIVILNPAHCANQLFPDLRINALPETATLTTLRLMTKCGQNGIVTRGSQS